MEREIKHELNDIFGVIFAASLIIGAAAWLGGMAASAVMGVSYVLVFAEKPSMLAMLAKYGGHIMIAIILSGALATILGLILDVKFPRAAAVLIAVAIGVSLGGSLLASQVHAVTAVPINVMVEDEHLVISAPGVQGTVEIDIDSTTIKTQIKNVARIPLQAIIQHAGLPPGDYIVEKTIGIKIYGGNIAEPYTTDYTITWRPSMAGASVG